MKDVLGQSLDILQTGCMEDPMRDVLGQSLDILQAGVVGWYTQRVKTAWPCMAEGLHAVFKDILQAGVVGWYTQRVKTAWPCMAEGLHAVFKDVWLRDSMQCSRTYG